jgi:hypothetical protein
MALRIWIAGLSIAAAACVSAAARQPASVGAIAPGGPGVLTKCRDWLVATSCHHYHHISLPSRVALGDTVDVIFGSSPKEYAFPVAQIVLTGRRCILYSEAHGNREQMDKITITPCRRADEAR